MGEDDAPEEDKAGSEHGQENIAAPIAADNFVSDGAKAEIFAENNGQQHRDDESEIIPRGKGGEELPFARDKSGQQITIEIFHAHENQLIKQGHNHSKGSADDAGYQK